jgi:hypothetical protein
VKRPEQTPATSFCVGLPGLAAAAATAREVKLRMRRNVVRALGAEEVERVNVRRTRLYLARPVIERQRQPVAARRNKTPQLSSGLGIVRLRCRPRGTKPLRLRAREFAWFSWSKILTVWTIWSVRMLPYLEDHLFGSRHRQFANGASCRTDLSRKAASHLFEKSEGFDVTLWCRMPFCSARRARMHGNRQLRREPPEDRRQPIDGEAGKFRLPDSGEFTAQYSRVGFGLTGR